MELKKEAKEEKEVKEDKENLTLSLFKTNPLKKVVEVRSVNPIKGKGVFATKHIQTGEFIAFYPIDTIQRRDTELTPKTQKEYDMIRLYNRYTISLKNPELIGVVVNIDDDGWPYVGHRINDGDAILAYTTREKTPSVVKSYETLSKSRQNVETFSIGKTDHGLAIWGKRKFVGVAATRDILKGEELFMHYGAKYWFDFLLHNTVEE